MSARVSNNYEYVEGWGMSTGAHGRVLRPIDVEGIRDSFVIARADRVPLGLRGSGNSYGDASVNAHGHVLDLTHMQRVLAFDPATGVAECEAGVSIEKLWKTILPHGWWPRVVSGTMFPTLGGALAMNIHGKNQFQVGTIGEAARSFDIVLPSGEVRTCDRNHQSDLFHAAIGGFGMLGVISRVVIETKKVHSGDLEVSAKSVTNLSDALAFMESKRRDADYMVAWIDCFGRGAQLGRGLIHTARYLAEGEDPNPSATLRIEHQELPKNILGVVPKSEVWRMLRLFNHDPGMRFINAVKYTLSAHEEQQGPHRQAHAAFAFLLDYVPNWKWAYGRTERRGLIQFQAFVPHARAHDVFATILERSQRARIVPWLGVLKRHKPDPFWLTHGLDGWSFALDFKVSPETRGDLWRHCADLTRLVLDAGGRFYFAKDSVVGADDVARMFPREKLAAFIALKRALDPENLLQTDLSRRVLGAQW